MTPSSHPGSGLCTTAHCCGISQHHARHPAAHQTVLRPAELHGHTQPLDRAYMCAFKNSIRQEVAKHFAEFFLEVESNFEHVNLDSSTAVLRQLLLSFVHTAAQNADSPQHGTAGWRFIDWNEVEQREFLAEAKRFLETGELFPRGAAEEPHAPDAETQASDSEPEAHVVEPLVDDHSSDDGEDAPTGVEESAAPAAPAVAAAPKRAAMGQLERLQAILSHTGAHHHHDSISASVSLAKRKVWCTIRDQESQGKSSASPALACMSASIASLSFVVAHSSPVPSLVLRIGSNDQRDGSQCCPSFGGCPRAPPRGGACGSMCFNTGKLTRF